MEQPVSTNKPLEILFANDGSRDSEAAFQFLRGLPLAPGSHIHAVTVASIAEWHMPPWLYEIDQKWSRQVLDLVCEIPVQEGVEMTAAIRHGKADHEILKCAEEMSADLIVVGSKGLTGIDEFMLGGVARNVAKYAKCSVLIARQQFAGTGRVVLAVDESPTAAVAVKSLGEFPLPETAQVTVVNVVRPYNPYPGLVPDDPVGFRRQLEEVQRKQHETAAALVAEAVGTLEAAGKTCTAEVRCGDPASEILRLVNEQLADLLVAGARGASLIEGLLVGSVADRLLKKAECSVLIVR
jgi:nucleotide-binding universal stress UspA family protein